MTKPGESGVTVAFPARTGSNADASRGSTVGNATGHCAFGLV
jgi:hypothetical protein